MNEHEDCRGSTNWNDLRPRYVFTLGEGTIYLEV